MTWANEPPSEEEQFKVKQERSLMRAVLKGDEWEVQRLLEEQGGVIDVNFESSGRSRPMHAAASVNSVEICNMLLKAGAEINATNSLGYTPLFVAVVNENKQVAQLLIESGADTKRKSKHNQTLKDIATPSLAEALSL